MEHEVDVVASLATAATIANLWSHLVEQDFSGKDEELIPVGEVFKIFKDTLVLIGNSSNYISQLKRKDISDNMKSPDRNCHSS